MKPSRIPPQTSANSTSTASSKPKSELNRNPIYVSVNERLIRDRLIQHAIIEAYRNICRPRFPGGAAVSRPAQRRSGRQCAPLEDRSPFWPAERDARFRARSVRAALIKARPVPQSRSISAHPTPAHLSRAVTQAVTRPWRRSTPTGSSPSACRPRYPAGERTLEFGAGIRVEGDGLCLWGAPPELAPESMGHDSALRRFRTKRKFRAICPGLRRSNRWARFANPSSWR